MSKKYLSMLVAGVMALSTTGAFAMDSMMTKAKVGVMVGGAMMVPNLNIVQNALNAKNVTTVVAAVKAAGLVDTLSGTGPFTVFAPNNDAFKRLPKGTVESLLKPENKAMLTSILTYHVVAGKYTSADLKDGMTLTTVNGATLKVKKMGRVLWINNARVATKDIISSNGVTFVIGTVLMPPKGDDMMMHSSMSSSMMSSSMSSSAMMSSSSSSAAMMNGAMMMNSTMLMMKDGKTTTMSSTMDMAGGMSVTKDGSVMWKNGMSMKMMNGDMMTSDGKMTTVEGLKTADKMFDHGAVLRRFGKVFTLMGGVVSPVTETYTTSDGMMSVMASGMVTMKDGTSMMMMDGGMMMMDGGMMMGGKMTGVVVGGSLMVPSLNIVENAMKAKNVTTLVAAVKAAGLVDSLSTPGPFTVFAPTNDAFAKLPAGTVDTLLKPESKNTLTSVLTYHVVAGSYKAADLKDGMTLKTVQGQMLTVKLMDGKVWIVDAMGGKAMVQTADVISSNGVTHVIDTVLMPK